MGFTRIAGAVLAAGSASLAAGTPATAEAPAVAARVAAATDACASASAPAIQIDDLAFQPPAVSPGQLSRATLSAVNCTARPQQAGAQWWGRFVGSSPGIPPGCPALDPLVLPMSFPAHGRLTGGVGYLVPASCTASGFVLTVEILQNGTVVAQRTATLAIGSGTGSRAARS